MPANQDSAFHQSIFCTAINPKWNSLLGKSRMELNFKTPLYYSTILSKLTLSYRIWETIYYHEMESLDSLIDWGKTTVMRPFLIKLTNEEQKQTFIQEVKECCEKDYPYNNSNRVIYAQKRLFFVAYKNIH